MGKSYTNGDIVYDKLPAAGGDKVKTFGMKARGAFDDIKNWFNDIVGDDGNLKISKLKTNDTDGLVKLDSTAQIPYIYNSARVKRALDHQNPHLVANPPADWNLATRFASEISGYIDVAAWIKARCTANDFSDMYPGDYFEHGYGTETARKARLLGINTYKNSADTPVPSHIDFCSGLDYDTSGYKWNLTNINNGTEAEPSPYRASNLFSEYASTILNKFPAWLSGKITEKRALLPSRYSSGGTLTDDTGWAWNSMGKVWAFFEEEVTGQVYWQTKGYTGYFKHYPIFLIQPAWTAIFGRGGFWGAGAHSGSSAYACYFSYNGYCSYYDASYSFCASLGFRISA